MDSKHPQASLSPAANSPRVPLLLQASVAPSLKWELHLISGCVLAAYLLNHPGDSKKCLCLSLTPRKSRSRGLGCNLGISMFPRAIQMTRTCGQGQGASAEVISC